MDPTQYLKDLKLGLSVVREHLHWAQAIAKGGDPPILPNPPFIPISTDIASKEMKRLYGVGASTLQGAISILDMVIELWDGAEGITFQCLLELQVQDVPFDRVKIPFLRAFLSQMIAADRNDVARWLCDGEEEQVREVNNFLRCCVGWERGADLRPEEKQVIRDVMSKDDTPSFIQLLIQERITKQSEENQWLQS